MLLFYAGIFLTSIRIEMKQTLTGQIRIGALMSATKGRVWKQFFSFCFLLALCMQVNAQVTIEPVFGFASRQPGSSPIVAYPNPVSTHLILSVAEGVEIDGIEVRDNSGNLIFEGAYEESVVWFVSAMVTGVYYLIVSTSEGDESVQVIVE